MFQSKHDVLTTSSHPKTKSFWSSIIMSDLRVKLVANISKLCQTCPPTTVISITVTLMHY